MAHELFQHIKNIHEASQTFIWENVCDYDIMFRELMEKNPWRNWGILYQQGYMSRLKEFNSASKKDFFKNNPNSEKRGKSTATSKKEHCWKFNRGKCPYGSNCRFEHRCSICNKIGHNSASSYKKEKREREKEAKK